MALAIEAPLSHPLKAVSRKSKTMHFIYLAYNLRWRAERELPQSNDLK